MTDSTITTGAVGRTRAPPDRVELVFETRVVEPEVTAARRSVARRATELRRVVVDAGATDENVRTARFRVRRQPPGHGGDAERDPESRPFEATETVAVTLDDLDALGDILAAGVDEAEAEIEDVTFTFRTETKRELEREAVTDAVTTARRKAEAAAAAEGADVGGVRSLTTEDRSRARQSGAALGAGAAEQSGTAPSSGPIDVTVGVTVEYELVESP
ncbi:SIMPL domain-containing protein [Halorussus sp. MSC15.2]|uniref:SIMPL domain-containing protein n=1 Tax=Halorussus sp. MSC15.2 TaxID=2283638 RepID=UPI0013D80CE8|nr:SIMPL domain-containing protein [Halorussus sp. MSC15.2]NEU58088.1 SIMPL domain-containing protein [Halorussus sp. MSC15.2]